MTPQERLKEIEKFIDLGQRVLGINDTRWLIARVKRLTEALEMYAMTSAKDDFASAINEQCKENAFLAREVLPSDVILQTSELVAMDMKIKAALDAAREAKEILTPCLNPVFQGPMAIRAREWFERWGKHL